jgi:hypothetical protein
MYMGVSINGDIQNGWLRENPSIHGLCGAAPIFGNPCIYNYIYTYTVQLI